MKALTVQEIEKVCAESSPMLQAMVQVAFHHGMRASEVTELRWEDVDLEERTIVVRRLKGSLTSKRTLSDKELDAIAGMAVDSRSKYVFPSPRSWRSPVDRTTFYRWFNAAAEAAGLPKDKRHPHCLKHSLGFALVAANVNMAVIQQALGHRNIANTVIYAAPTEEQVDRLVREALK